MSDPLTDVTDEQARKLAYELGIGVIEAACRLAVLSERERCAKVCEQQLAHTDNGDDYDAACADCADAIRGDVRNKQP